ncbi:MULTISPECIES: MucR family transcriptional regulator [unclassified Sphingobium]|uniref:MucR family transcriptional regulator n=1 Tax=unclassified Sphingobium TaxID=2611147 RepID=UPI001A1A4310|nr:MULTISPECIES: MucR family transcriptional regulator [unclassified Sphingobium]MBG6116400.1 putative transcriptional regulator [Sphingobium sp. JAI105]
MAAETEMLITLTAEIISAHVSHNRVSASDVPGLIEAVYGALSALGAPTAPEDEKSKGAVSIRASIKPDHLVSMIDGKAYKMLKRHLSLNGYTPETYREAFDLPRDYPMVAASYAQQRRTLAHKIGLGRKPRHSPASEPAAQPLKSTRKPRSKKATPDQPVNGGAKVGHGAE